MPAIFKWMAGLLAAGVVLSQCRRPWGWLGRRIARAMNITHAGLTTWGLDGIDIGAADTILDVGCGGGETVNRLAGLAPGGRVYGLDYSSASVAVAQDRNRSLIQADRVDIRQGTVSAVPFADATFDLATAVETHYYWPDLTSDLREVLRVLKPGGRILVIAEAYRGRTRDLLYRPIMALLGARYLTPDQHRDALLAAGYADVQVRLEPRKGWLRATAHRARPAADVPLAPPQ